MVFSLLCCSVLELSPSTLIPHPPKKVKRLLSWYVVALCISQVSGTEDATEACCAAQGCSVADLHLQRGFPATEVMHNQLLTS